MSGTTHIFTHQPGLWPKGEGLADDLVQLRLGGAAAENEGAGEMFIMAGGQRLIFLLAVCALWKVLKAFRGQTFQTLCLGKECGAKSARDFALADDPGEAGNCAGASGDANVGVLAVRVDSVGNNSLGVRLGKFDGRGFLRGFFVQDRPEFGFKDDFLENGVFGAVEIFALLVLRHFGEVQRPDADFRDFERVQHIHGYGVRALVGEVTANATGKTFERLAYINRLTVVVVKCVNAPFVAADGAAVRKGLRLRRICADVGANQAYYGQPRVPVQAPEAQGRCHAPTPPGI